MDSNEIKSKVDDLLRNSDESFADQMLRRMQSDCEYYLGHGNRHPRYLWADNEKDHIAYMKEIWSRFPEDKKPEWLSFDKILEYEKKMIPEKPPLSRQIQHAEAMAVSASSDARGPSRGMDNER